MKVYVYKVKVSYVVIWEGSNHTRFRSKKFELHIRDNGKQFEEAVLNVLQLDAKQDTVRINKLKHKYIKSYYTSEVK